MRVSYRPGNLPARPWPFVVEDAPGAGGTVAPAKDLKELLAYIKAGRVKAYGTTSRLRLETLSELPPLAEAGLLGFEVVVWHGAKQ